MLWRLTLWTNKYLSVFPLALKVHLFSLSASFWLCVWVLYCRVSVLLPHPPLLSMQLISMCTSSSLSLSLLLSLQLSVMGPLQHEREGETLPSPFLSIYAFCDNQNYFILLILDICIPAVTVQLFSAFLVPVLPPWLGSTCHIQCFHQDGQSHHSCFLLWPPCVSRDFWGGFRRFG